MVENCHYFGLCYLLCLVKYHIMSIQEGVRYKVEVLSGSLIYYIGLIVKFTLQF